MNHRMGETIQWQCLESLNSITVTLLGSPVGLLQSIFIFKNGVLSLTGLAQ